MNIAEGKGRIITLANIFYKREWIKEEDLKEVENKGYEIASMIKGLINKLDG